VKPKMLKNIVFFFFLEKRTDLLLAKIEVTRTPTPLVGIENRTVTFPKQFESLL
jgi:hypothetical protein